MPTPRNFAPRPHGVQSPRPSYRCCRSPLGFSLFELLIAVVIVAIIAAIGIPAYRGHVATARDAALIEQMTTMTVFQEDRRLRTGTYGAGVYDPANNVDTLTTAIGWQPSAESGDAYTVVANGGTSWTVTANANGRQLCRIYPANEPCP